MNALTIELSMERAAFEPGGELAGKAAWKLDHPPSGVELRLFWFTSGRGNQDAGVVETVRFDHPLAAETRPFLLRLPEAPYSFAGQLISMKWALELVAEPSKTVARRELIVAPGGEVVRLDRLADPQPRKRFFSR